MSDRRDSSDSGADSSHGGPSLTELERIHKICTAFEEALKQGKAPRIENYLGDFSGRERVQLLRELLHLELDYRSRRGDPFDPADYIKRFPEGRAAVEAALGSPTISSPGPHPGPTGDETVAPQSGPFLYSGDDLVNEVAAAAAAFQHPTDPLCECRRCKRLVETQFHQGMAVQPKFCPWCGKPVTPILTRELDGYRIEKLISQGGFGFTYLASNIAEPKMKAVVKFLRPEMGYRRPELIRVFVEEARLTEEIGQTCGNVVRVSNVREKPWPCYFMEFIRGPSVDEVLKRKDSGKLPLEDCKGYLRGMAKALVATHAHGRVHRDLKPLNLMIIESREMPSEERLKLIDFGLAMKIAGGKVGASVSLSTLPPDASSGDDSSAVENPSSPLQSAGTPEYMAPEAFDGRSEFYGDTYSFGVTAYEILTGESPWPAAPSGAQRFFYWRDAHKKTPPRPLREVRPEVPSWLARVIMDCLEKVPEKRIRSADDLLSRLKEPVPQWVWLASAAALVLVAVLGWFAVVGGGEMRTAIWQYEDRPLGDTLWVKNADALRKVKLIASASEDTSRKDLQITDCSSPSSGVECQVEDGKIRVSFNDPSVLGSRISIAGTGDGFRLEGKIQILQDDVPPILGELKLVDFGALRALPDDKRFKSTAVLAIHFEENHPREARLLSKDGKGGVNGERKAFGDEDYWEFPLSSLRPGPYRGYIEADDEAGNKARLDEIKFLVDDAVSLAAPADKDEQRFVARGKAFYEFRTRERIAEMKVRAGEEVEFELFDAKVSNALDLSQRLDRIPRVSDLGRVEKNHGYLLALAVEGESASSFQLHVTDTATPPNDKTLTLKFRPPARLTRKHVSKVSITFEGEASPVELTVREDSDSLALTLPTPTSSSLIETLEVSFAPQFIHKATCTLGNESQDAIVDYKSLHFSDLVLDYSDKKMFVGNKILLVFSDPMERDLPLELMVKTDHKKPEVKVHAKWTGDHAAVWVEATEPLSEAKCHVEEEVFSEKPDEPTTRIEFDLESLQLKEADHRLRVHCFDLAGNLTEERTTLVVNTKAPTIDPKVETGSAGELLLKTNDFVFEVHDGNGLNYDDKTTVTFEPEGGAPVTEQIARPPGGGNTHVVGLSKLASKYEKGCKGQLTVRIADGDGKEALKSLAFRFTPLPSKWKPNVPWQDIDWILVPATDRTDFYISRCEINNAKYLEFYKSGWVGKPKYFSKSGPPVYRKNGKRVPNSNDFPVVGVTPEQAQDFASRLGARLPTYEQWKRACWKWKPGIKHPLDVSEFGKDYVNCHLAWESQKSPFKKHHYDRTMLVGTRPIICRAVEADFNPFPKTNKKHVGEILHLIGNVGEIVSEGNVFYVVGGHYDTSFKDISLLSPDRSRFETANAWTGFRIVIDPENANPEFLKKARGQ